MSCTDPGLSTAVGTRRNMLPLSTAIAWRDTSSWSRVPSSFGTPSHGPVSAHACVIQDRARGSKPMTTAEDAVAASLTKLRRDQCSPISCPNPTYRRERDFECTQEKLTPSPESVQGLSSPTAAPRGPALGGGRQDVADPSTTSRTGDKEVLVSVDACADWHGHVAVVENLSSRGRCGSAPSATGRLVIVRSRIRSATVARQNRRRIIGHRRLAPIQ